MELGFVGRGATMSSVAVVLLAACGGGVDDVHAVSGVEASASDEPAVGLATATLVETNGSGVTGEAGLRWDRASGILTVSVALQGLEPEVRYSAQITPGCGMGTGHIHKLDDLVGGPAGTAEQITEIAGVESVDFDGDWSVKVGRPPAGGGHGGGSPGGGARGAAGPQACGAVAPAP